VYYPGSPLPVLYEEMKRSISGSFQVSQITPLGGRLQITPIISRNVEEYNIYENRSIYNQNLFVTLAQPIFGKNEYAIIKKTKQINLATSIAKLENTKRTVVHEIADKYLLLLTKQEVLKKAKELKHIADKLKKLTELRAKMGLVTEEEKLSSLAELMGYEASLLKKEKEYENIKDALIRLTGIEKGEFVLVEPKIEEEQYDEPELVRLALENDPYLASLKLQKSIKRMEVRNARLDMLPGISLNAYGNLIRKAKSLISGEEFRGRNFGLYISLDIPIFDFGAQAAELRSRSAELSRVNLEIEKEKTLIKDEVRSLLRDLKVRKKRIEIFRLAKEAAQKSFIMYKAKYEEGIADIDEVLNALKRYKDSEESLLLEKGEYYKDLMKIRLLKGISRVQ